MISEKRLSEALTFLAESDLQAAELLAEMERAEFKAKAVKDAVFLHGEEGTVADRAAKAGSSADYHTAMARYFDAVKQYNAVRNKRQTEALVVDVWRSLESSRRKGNI